MINNEDCKIRFKGIEIEISKDSSGMYDITDITSNSHVPLVQSDKIVADPNNISDFDIGTDFTYNGIIIA